MHEEDAPHFQQKLESYLHGRLNSLGLNAFNFELHATDIKNGNRDWSNVGADVRFSVLRGAFRTLATFEPSYKPFPVAFFGVVVEYAKVPDRKARERLCYELILNKFDAMLGRINREHKARQHGLVVHDQRVVHGGQRVWTDERAIQEWTRDWRVAAEKVGQLRNFADIPLFVDSQATRLIQAADLVCYSLWRRYGPSNDSKLLDTLVDGFDNHGGVMHGLMHYTRDFASGRCHCPPCDSRRKHPDQFTALSAAEADSDTVATVLELPFPVV